VPEEDGEGIDLVEVLSDFQVAGAGSPWEDGAEMMACPNLRSAHVSLHRLDSQPPLLVAGKPEGVSVPDHPRIIDMAPFCCTCLQSDLSLVAVFSITGWQVTIVLHFVTLLESTQKGSYAE
jgi:hypothetical protein